MPGCTRLGLFTGPDPLGGTAAPLRHLPPDALPMSALSADELDGAHAVGEPTGQSCSSPSPPSLAFTEEPWRAELASPLLRLLIPGLAVPAGVSAQATVQVPSVRPQNDAGSIANATSHLPSSAVRFWARWEAAMAAALMVIAVPLLLTWGAPAVPLMGGRAHRGLMPVHGTAEAHRGLILSWPARARGWRRWVCRGRSPGPSLSSPGSRGRSGRPGCCRWSRHRSSCRSWRWTPVSTASG